jgi:rhamnopyranosyl-N-acetylglucosaminyl-diphospho-decaprenol beta-1,3/1,4-galactofuranosyltransferase
MQVAALVVTHNRVDLLRRCLTSLVNQTRGLDAIIVVDNLSSDGTTEMVCESFPDVTLLHSQENLGGAGGFAAGIEYLIQHGYDCAWIMDDDAYAEHSALAPLVDAMGALGTLSKGQPGFLASNVQSPDGFKTAAWRYPRPHKSVTDPCPTPSGTSPIGHAIFVGVLVNLHAARLTYLPVADFFLWWDDTEYTSRLQRLAGGFYCESSAVYHPINPSLKDLGVRLRYDLRNRLWIIKDNRLGSPTSLMKARRGFWSRVGTQALHATSKSLYARCVLTGVAEGLFRRPRLRLPVIPHDELGL